MLTYLLAAVVILIAALLAFGLAFLLHLQGAAYLIFVALILVLGIAAAVTILVLHYRAQKQKALEGAATGTEASGDLDLLLDEANKKLRGSQTGPKSLEGLPLIYILGDSSSAKTTTVMRSGLDPELVAGSASHDVQQVTTEVLNIWFTSSAALVEVGAAVRQSNGLFERLVHRTRAKAYQSAFGAGAAPRAVIVCVSMDQLLAADGGESLLASARGTAAQLRELSRLLGMPIPVYVIVTKLDRVAHFEEYVRNLSEDEVRSVLGASLPRSEASAGTYADQAAKDLAGVIDGLVYKLGEFRVEMLGRENDSRNTAGVYEFPREFGKLRKNLGQYLVELCKPSHLSANPYLRGFYFTGIRARVVEKAVAAPAAVRVSSVQEAGATQFLDISRIRSESARTAAAPVMVSSRVPQWTFLPRLLREIVLGDKSALAATRQSAPARLFRRILFGSLAFVLAVYIVFLLVSYSNNAALEGRISAAAKVLPTGITSTGAGELKALDDLRQTIAQLDDYKQNGAPFSYRFGLYQGDKLNVRARHIYFDRFRTMMLNPAQTNFVAVMHGLPDVPAAQTLGDKDAYNTAYYPLKAYLITTSHPEKSDPKFLTPVFLQAWVSSRPLDDAQKALASRQIDFYGAELLRQPPYNIAPDAALVDHTQGYLSNFLADTRIYESMLADADKAGTPIDFNRQYPDAVKWVRDDRAVRGAFSRTGFDAMQNAIKNPDKYAQGERWVLGDKGSQLPDPATLSTSLGSKYEADYLNAWNGFLQGARVAHCGSLSEASAELDALSGPTSPILELFFTISHNTAVPDQAISKIFQPAQAVVDPNATSRLTGPGNEPYLQALAGLKSAVDLAAPNPAVKKDPAAFQPVATAVEAAKGAVKPISLSFNVDPDRSRHTEATVADRMLDPISCVADQAPTPGAGANGAGQKLCGAISPLLGKFPFAPNSTAMAGLTEVDGVFAPDTGSLWVNYGTDLKSILLPSGTNYVVAPDAPPKTNQKFAEYFNRAAHVSSALYAPGQHSASFTFNLKFIPGNGVSNATFVVDGQRIAAGSNAQQFTWTGSTAQKTTLVYDNNEAFSFTGTWSLFQMVRSAKIAHAGGVYRLDYPISTVVAGHVVSTGKTATFELSGTGADFLAGDGFAGLSCVQPVVFK